MTKVDLEVFEFKPGKGGEMDVHCNREPTEEELLNIREGLPLGCEINCIFPEDDYIELNISSNECCGKSMKVSTAERDPFTWKVNKNIGKLWCSVCGKYGK